MFRFPRKLEQVAKELLVVQLLDFVLCCESSVYLLLPDCDDVLAHCQPKILRMCNLQIDAIWGFSDCTTHSADCVKSQIMWNIYFKG